MICQQLGCAAKRHPLLPDVKTFQEMGIPGVDSDNWYALFTSKATAVPDLERLNQAELALLLKNDTAKWGKVIRDNKIKAE